MLSIKRKLSSKSGASMLLAMVFLMFCLFIGGSVLAAATANGSRVEHLKNDQQDYLSQRSAMLLMSDMLTGTDGKELQVTITDVTMTNTPADGSEPTTSHTVTFISPTLATGETPSLLQKMLFEIVVAKEGAGTIKCNSLGISELSATSADQLLSGTINASATHDGASHSCRGDFRATGSATLLPRDCSHELTEGEDQ